MDSLIAIAVSCPIEFFGKGPRHATFMQRLLKAGQAAGNLAHDAHIAALCVEHDFSELGPNENDFARYSRIPVRIPFSSQS